MVNESTSENIVLQGYISNTNLTNFDFDNTSETIFNSLSALRSREGGNRFRFFHPTFLPPQFELQHFKQKEYSKFLILSIHNQELFL